MFDVECVVCFVLCVLCCVFCVVCFVLCVLRCVFCVVCFALCVVVLCVECVVCDVVIRYFDSIHHFNKFLSVAM